MRGSFFQAPRQLLLSGLLLLAMPALLPAGDRDRVSPAVRRSLELLQQTAATYTDQRDCFSCHHQALPSMAVALAASRGFDVNRPQLAWQGEFTANFFLQRSEKLEQGKGVPGGPYTAAYAAVQLAADGKRQPRASELLVSYLRQTRQQEGHWKIQTHRPPLEDSDFTATALSLAALRLHVQDADLERTGQEIRQAVHWLALNPGSTTEDRVFRLLGIYWGSVDARRGAGTHWSRLFAARATPGMDVETRKSFQQTVTRLLEQQHEDGGWSQLEDGTSDAYASGQVVAALLGTGAARPGDESIRRGIDYLLTMQQEDGSWHVASRSKAFQEYFESGFPHGTDQFIAVSASSWATMALVLSRPERSSRRHRKMEK
jgi:N-acyl-D-amino-acid deacylase